MNITEQAINKLLNYYNLKTLNELADKMKTAQSTISGWKARNAIGALVDTVASKDLKALEYIFRSKHINKVFDLSSNNHSQDSINIIENNVICETKILKMNQTIVSSFINVYDKLEKKGDLKRLHKILGEIEFE